MTTSAAPGSAPSARPAVVASAHRRAGRRWIVPVAALLGVVLTVNLGFWQLRRAAQKLAIQTALDTRGAQPQLGANDLPTVPASAAAIHYRRVHLRGRWLPQHTVFLENRQMNARVGFYVVTPLLLSERSGAVLVQRGWVPRDLLDRTHLPDVDTPAGQVEVQGRIAPPPARLFDFAPSARGLIRQNIDVTRFAAETGQELFPFSVQQSVVAGQLLNDGLARQWSRPAVDIQMHYGYAFQWFALAALMAGLYVWFQLVRPRLACAS